MIGLRRQVQALKKRNSDLRQRLAEVESDSGEDVEPRKTAPSRGSKRRRFFDGRRDGDTLSKKYKRDGDGRGPPGGGGHGIAV